MSRPGVDGEALRLLGREVGGRAHHRAGAGEPVAGAVGPGDAEVGDLHLAAGVMSTLPGFMSRCTTPFGARRRAPWRCRRRSRPTAPAQRAVGADHVAEGAAVHVLHHDEGGALLLAPVVDRDDGGVVQAGGRLGLEAEALDERRVARELGEQHLERDGTVELAVVREVDVGHAAASDLADDLVAVGVDGGVSHAVRSRYLSVVGPGCSARRLDTRQRPRRYWPSRKRSTCRGRLAPRPGHRSPRSASVAAVLDDHRHRVLRRLGRGKCDEPRVRAAHSRRSARCRSCPPP